MLIFTDCAFKWAPPTQRVHAVVSSVHQRGLAVPRHLSVSYKPLHPASTAQLQRASTRHERGTEDARTMLIAFLHRHDAISASQLIEAQGTRHMYSTTVEELQWVASEAFNMDLMVVFQLGAPSDVTQGQVQVVRGGTVALFSRAAVNRLRC